MRHYLLSIVTMLAMLSISACSESSMSPEEPSYIEVAKTSDIQGVWHNSSYGTYRSVTFKEDHYTIRFMDEKTNKITDSENGIFVLDETTMTLKSASGESKFNPLEIYWEDKLHTQLKIYPLGSFVRNR